MMNATTCTTLGPSLVTDLSSYEHDHQDWRDIVLLCVYSIIFIIGVIGNLIVFCIFNRKRDGSSQIMDFLIICLANVDMLSSIVNPGMFIYWTVTHYAKWHFGYVGCTLLPSLTRVLVSFSIGIIIIITLDRYYVICRPFEEHLSRLKVYVYVYVALLISIAMDLPYLIHQQVLERPHICAVPDISVPGFAYPMMTILVFRDLAFLFVFIVTVCLIRKELFDKEKLRVLGKMRSCRNLRKVTLMLTVMALVFMLLVFPRDIFHVIYIASWISPPGLIYSRSFLDVNGALKILHMTNSIVNVFIYARLHGVFRKRLRKRFNSILRKDSYRVNVSVQREQSFSFVDLMINDSLRDKQDGIERTRTGGYRNGNDGHYLVIPLLETQHRQPSLHSTNELQELALDYHK